MCALGYDTSVGQFGNLLSKRPVKIRLFTPDDSTSRVASLRSEPSHLNLQNLNDYGLVLENLPEREQKRNGAKGRRGQMRPGRIRRVAKTSTTNPNNSVWTSNCDNGKVWACSWTGLLHEGRNTPHLNPLPCTTTGLPRKYGVRRVVRLRSVRLGSPKGRGNPPGGIATASRSYRERKGLHQICHSTKRTHRFATWFLM